MSRVGLCCDVLDDRGLQLLQEGVVDDNRVAVH
jgi:hypothetical protein